MAQRESSSQSSSPAKSLGQKLKPQPNAANASLHVGPVTSTALSFLVCLMARTAAKDWLRCGRARKYAESANGHLDGLAATAAGSSSDQEGGR
jgi:hypothetical protein